MFTNASNFVQGVDFAFAVILGISIFFLVTLTATMIYFVIKYNRNKKVKAVQIKEHTWVEVTWIVIPLILVLYMFYIGWEGFIPMRQAPKDAMHVKAIGKMWKWTFEYEGNKQADTLVLPIGKAVKIDLVSTDVLHGFSVPAFRIKEDVVPVKKNYTWFIPGELGDFDLFCTVYCGLNHSSMLATIRVVSEEDFQKWIAKVPVKKAEANNLAFQAVEKNGCLACHSMNGTKLVGPTFKGLYGSKSNVLTNGAARQVTVDDAYIEKSIYEPNADVANGYPQGVMKSYKGIVQQKDLKLIQEYLKSLK
ncbi:MAG: cytochrome c oxidase subunit II [Paludibacter sp.]|nr:cytochrome c oxidase subunit II [Paludibacter sp.]